MSMKKIIILLIISILSLNCNNNTTIENEKKLYLIDTIPGNLPITYKSDLTPPNMLIHKGIFSPDLNEYYYTLSDKKFEQFNVYYIKKKENTWSKPQKAFFNSNYNEHGMSFSPDGNTLYFSSTRPVKITGISSTWHIWKSEKINGQWNAPTFVNIPGLENKLTSHASITNTGTLYFHVSNPDFSEMDIYYSKRLNNKYQEAEKLILPSNIGNGKCTPYISPKEDYIIYATIGKQLKLMISFNEGDRKWTTPRALNSAINTLGQGNPSITPDNQFLFFTIGEHEEKEWEIKWVRITSELQKNPIK